MVLKFGAYALMGLTLLACKKDQPAIVIRNLEQGTIKAFGHGGMGINSLLPIDSYESLTKSLSLGADGTEMDIQMSADSVLFLFHASDLNENTNCSGAIPFLTSAQIDCAYKGLGTKRQKVCKLSEFLNGVGEYTDVIYTFECKNYQLQQADYGTYARSLKNICQQFGIENRVMFESNSPEFLRVLLSTLPQAKVFLYDANVEKTINTADSLNLFGVTFDFKWVTKELVALAHKKNLRVTLFNQKTEADNKFTLTLQPDFIQTDKLKHLISLVK